MTSAFVNLTVDQPFTLESKKENTLEAIEDLQNQLNERLTHYKDIHGEEEKLIENEISKRIKQQEQDDLSD